MSSDLITLASGDICKDPDFLSDFEHLTTIELSQTSAQPLTDLQVRRLLESVAVLSLSAEESHQKLAYKIAVFLLNQRRGEVGPIPFITELVLTRLGDLPVIRQMVDDKIQDYFGYFDSAANAT